MTEAIFTPEDLRQIEARGQTPEKIQQQVRLFEKPPSYLKLLRPATLGDGIKKVDADEAGLLITDYEQQILTGRCLKFVPASGAASRMFKFLLSALNGKARITKDEVLREARENEGEARELLTFMDDIRRFAFFDDLRSALAEKGLAMEDLLEKGDFTDVVDLLLTDRGLGYADLPKGLLKFHSYPEGSRTAFEEHLVESVSYAADGTGRCRLHFTVSPDHLALFRSLLEKAGPEFERKLGALFEVAFSVQKESTDTIAVDLANRPFRQEDGRLLFRPGGHGALLENLNELNGDVVFIKNIDNVVPDRLKEETGRWKKILGGCLLNLQNRIFDYAERLSSSQPGERVLREAAEFIRNELSMAFPPDFRISPSEATRQAILEKLNRPLRVCGMVRNLGEPGGGPFWAEDEEGGGSLQIVESAQVDPDSAGQQEIFKGSTHFNPVDLVCGVRDRHGKPFDLRRYADPNAYIVTRKSKDGKDLKALEHPGLWNGGMARWTTVFVEVPLVTFNPVKTVNDLLREEHQPG